MELMTRLSKKWKVYIIHHSHTDIGYTERQDKITTYHVDFIRQAIDILNSFHSGEKPEYKGFVWQCENHWQVKNFYKEATPKEIKDFEKYVKNGEIGLSGNYLNMTELVGYDVLSSRLRQVREYAEFIDKPITSSMTADVNGFAWGYSEALYENAVTSLFTCIHTHHGMFPLYKKQLPFYWQTPKGEKLLVWNGEHYHFGNELCLCPRASSSYLIIDEFSKKIQSAEMFCTDKDSTKAQELECLNDRVYRYLANLESEGYPCDFVPVMVSGAVTDNAPPNGEIARRVNELNEKHKGNVQFEMITLENFFEIVRREYKDIPTYSGDWNDWWADGVGSTALAVKNYRTAQRKLSISNKLDPQRIYSDKALIEKACENMMLYAEHTWGYSSSVLEPWESMVSELELKKSAYAINANTQISKNLDKILRAMGEVSIHADKNQRFKVINFHNTDVETTAIVFVEFWEYTQGVSFSQSTVFEIVDEETGEVIPSQIKRIARAYQIEVRVSLKAGESKILRLRNTGKKQNHTVSSHALTGSDGVCDIAQKDGMRTDTSQIDTEHFCVKFDQCSGITSIINTKSGKELLHTDRNHAPFSGVYEVTDNIGESAGVSRSRMGRNRKAENTRRYESELTDIKVVENGEVYTAVQIDYKLEGTGFYQVFLMIYKDLPKIKARVRIHKLSVWDAENLYISLPFASKESWVDKTGCIIRPGIDQLPGTNQEFYLIQNGLVLCGDNSTLSLSIKDTPLIVFGDLKSAPIELCDGKNKKLNTSPAYAWVMNNFWETNFKADLGGFYEFDFALNVNDGVDVKAASMQNEIENEGIIAMYV